MNVYRRTVFAGAICIVAVAGCAQLVGPPPASRIADNAASERAAAAPTYRVLYSFAGNGDGIGPSAALTVVKSTLYGTTYEGGASNNGTVFSMTASGKEKVLYSFGNAPDGANPAAALIDVDGELYGTTYGGGYLDGGTVFGVTTTGTERQLHSFRATATDGSAPNAGLTQVHGVLYGTTAQGGKYNEKYYGDGTIFSAHTTGAGYRVAYNFGKRPSDGTNPYGGLVAVKGMLYGTTVEGGSGGRGGGGTVFSINPNGTGERILHNFPGFGTEDGNEPTASLLEWNGTLYGTTQGGGTYGSSSSSGHKLLGGTVFKITTAGKETVLYSFRNGKTDGCSPLSALVVMKGTLYGSTSGCGAYGGGTIFSVDPSSGRERILHAFGKGKDGVGPNGLTASNGTFYGTTFKGGARNLGTVFTLRP